jgi:hypothetical protein
MKASGSSDHRIEKILALKHQWMFIHWLININQAILTGLAAIFFIAASFLILLEEINTNK